MAILAVGLGAFLDERSLRKHLEVALLLSVPLGVVTVTKPVVAPAGTVAVK